MPSTADAGIAQEVSEYPADSHRRNFHSRWQDLIFAAVLVLAVAGDLALVPLVSSDVRLDA